MIKLTISQSGAQRTKEGEKNKEMTADFRKKKVKKDSGAELNSFRTGTGF